MNVFEQAQQRLLKANEAYSRIDADARLSGEAKIGDKARVWADTERDMQALRSQHVASTQQRQTELQRSLFGLPAGATTMDVMAHRDAMQRAASFDASDSDSVAAATRAMQTAAVSGDAQLAKAIAAQAVANGWHAVIDTYVQQIQPEAGPQLEELRALATQHPQRRVMEAMAFVNPLPPNMPANTSEWTLRAAADQAGEAA